MRRVVALAMLMLALAGGCSKASSPPVAEHVQVLPVSEMDGVAMGMAARDLHALYPSISVAPYAGYSDSTAAFTTTFMVSRPCASDARPFDDCPVRGTLEYIEVEFGWEEAEGQTVFIETWGEFFAGVVEPTYCYQRAIRFAPGGDSGQATVAHWDDESGFWAILRQDAVGSAGADSVRTSYRIGWGPHDHSVDGEDACATPRTPVPRP